MKMGWVEKLFVNSERHSRRVARHAEDFVRVVDPRPGQRLLDVGCGNGAAPVHLARTLGLAVTGVDVDPEQIADAKRRAEGLPEARFLTIDAERLPFEPDEFDVVFTNKVTHHVPDWQAAVSEMVRVLKPGGHLLYSDLVAPFGTRYPTRRAIDRLVARHGLELVSRSGSPVHYKGVFRKPAGPA
jgi:ubiquinone/menaquinone biosynthesis C-methylase UbiE